MPIPVARLKTQQEILYPPTYEYGWVALLDTTPKSFGFTVDPTSNIFTSTGHDFINTMRVKVSSTNTLPAPLVAGTIYYVRDVSGSTFKLALTSGGTAIDITTSGTGTHTIEEMLLDVSVSSTALWVRKEIDYEGTTGRKSYTPSYAVEDAVNSRVYTPEVSLSFVNDGASSMVFDGAVLIAGGTGTAGNTTGTIDLFDIFSNPQTIAPGETRIVKIPNIYANG